MDAEQIASNVEANAFPQGWSGKPIQVETPKPKVADDLSKLGKAYKLSKTLAEIAKIQTLEEFYKLVDKTIEIL